MCGEKVWAECDTGRERGITPACAGKSPGPPRAAPAAGDHPRVCGEKSAMIGDGKDVKGSPPRVRGKEIPPSPPKERTVDHPRVCGEKEYHQTTETAEEGSPPRVRGKVARARGSPNNFRITPACAGKSPRSRSGHEHSWDHPRVCGEKFCSRFCITAKRGSPPRVRGKVCRRPSETFRNGITPACAGKSQRAAGREHAGWDHPRVCGEKVRTALGLSQQEGSPPRVRGKAR